jgi:hypothetical protein
MRKSWTKRKLFTVTFKGREPRALLWRKGVYKEWFEYAKLAQKIGRKIPRAFGNLRKFDDFEDWWRHPDYGFELFCEKPTGDLVQEVTDKKTKLEPDEILLKVNLKGDLEIINRDIRKLLITKDVQDEYTSNARFQPSRPMKHLSIGATEHAYLENKKRQNKFAQYRETWLMAQEMSYEEVAEKQGWMTPSDRKKGGMMYFDWSRLKDDRKKKVRRHVEQVESIFESIGRGTFP